MGALSIGHWLVLLLVIVMLFGTKKLRTLGGDLGSALRDFKQAVKADEPAHSNPAASAQPEKIPAGKAQQVS